MALYIWNRVARYTHFFFFWSSLEMSEGSFFDDEPQISVSSTRTTPKWKSKANPKYSTGKRIFHKGDHLTKWRDDCPYTSPLFMNVFLHTSLAWGVTARHCTASTSGEFSNIWQSKRVGIIAIKNKRTRIRFHRYSPGGRGILNSLTWGIDWWRKKKLLPVTVLEPSVVFAQSPYGLKEN